MQTLCKAFSIWWLCRVNRGPGIPSWEGVWRTCDAYTFNDQPVAQGSQCRGCILKQFMSKFYNLKKMIVLTGCLAAACVVWGQAQIPAAAWKRPLGLPLENGGKAQKPGIIDDGYWQGVPVGGLGAGTFSRTYRGDFARWHIKAAVHKYEPIYANQFAMYQKSEGDSKGVAQVLMNGHPTDG